MADFGIINLQPEGDITSYDPPEALVYEFGTFHDEINDRIVSIMSLLPNSTARPSIDKLRRTKEKPGAKRSVLKANKAFSKIEIPKDTPVLAELDDNDTMNIPFFQYANVDKYYVLENQGKSKKEVLQQSVDLSKLKNRSDATPLTSYYHQDFDLKSEHPGVTFIDKQRASFAGFYTGPILDGHHIVALHGFLQEPVNIAVRSGFNTRVVRLPIGFKMVVPLKFGTIHFDDEGKPKKWTTIPVGLKRLPPPPPGDGGLPEFPEVPTNPVGERPITPATRPQRPSGTIPEPFDPSILNVPQPVEPPSLGEIEMPEILSTTQVTRLPVEGAEVETVRGPTGPAELQRATKREPVPVEAEAVKEAVPVEAEVVPVKEGEAVPVEAEEVPVEAEEVPVKEAEAVKEAQVSVKEAEAVPVEAEAATISKKVKPYIKTATVTPTFKEDVIADLAEYIKQSGVEIQDIEEELERYQPLISYLTKVTSIYPNKQYTIEMPAQTTAEEYDTFTNEATNAEDIVRIAFKDPKVEYEFRIEIASATPSNIVERIDGRVNIVAVSRPVSFRMKPNPNLMKYTLFLRRGLPVVVARPAKFRMEPNESLREFVKIEV